MYITTRDSDIENPRAPNFSYATSLLCINNFLSVGNIVIFRMRWVPSQYHFFLIVTDLVILVMQGVPSQYHFLSSKIFYLCT